MASRLTQPLRYIQNHALQIVATRGLAVTPDGVAELWWQDQAAMQANYTAETRGSLVEDERTFIGGLQVIIVNDAALTEADGTAKLMFVGMAASGARRARIWLETFAETLPGLVRFNIDPVSSGVRSEGVLASAPHPDFMAQFRFHSVTSAHIAADAGDVKQLIAAAPRAFGAFWLAHVYELRLGWG